MNKGIPLVKIADRVEVMLPDGRALTGTVGHFAALVALGALLGIGEDAAGKLFLLDGAALSWRVMTIPNSTGFSTRFKPIDANASLTSNRSMSSTVMPLRSRISLRRRRSGTRIAGRLRS